MAEREKVIDILGACGTDDCDNCPLNGDERCSGFVDVPVKVLMDTLALLREQEARVMTEGEVLHSTGKPIWFESRGMYLSKKGFWILPFEVDPELHIRFVQSVTGGKITLSLIDYGKLWRCWTSRPTEKQRKAVAWDG